MTGPHRIASAHDPVRPADGGAIELTVDGETVAGRVGQTIAGVLLASGRVSWRTSPRSGRPRGVFCGIGVCFDCLIVVNGLRDVRACQRRAADGDVITRQDDAEPPNTHPPTPHDGSSPGNPAAVPPGDGDRPGDHAPPPGGGDAAVPRDGGRASLPRHRGDQPDVDGGR